MFLKSLTKISIKSGNSVKSNNSFNTYKFKVLPNSYNNNNKKNLFTRWDPVDDLLKLTNTQEGLPPNKVLEFVGNSGSGKSQLLLAIIMVAILPYEISFSTPMENGQLVPISITLGGMNEIVVFINFNNQLNLLRLKSMILSHLELCLSSFNLTVDLEDFESLVSYSLNNLIVFDCNSIEDLENCLDKLQDLQSITTTHESGIRYLIIEHLSHTYWQLKTKSNEEGGKNELFYYQQKQIAQLEKIMQNYNCSLIVTNWVLFKIDPDANATNPQLELEPVDPNFPWREHMSSAWSDFVDYKVFFEQDTEFDKLDDDSSTKFQLRLVKPRGYSSHSQSIYIDNKKVYF